MRGTSDTAQNVKDASPLLGIEGIGVAFTWIEELLTVSSGFAVTIALGIGAVSLFSGGHLYFVGDALTKVYAIAMTVGVEGQLVGSAFKAGRSFKQGRIGAGIGHSIVALILAYVTYLAGWVYGYQETFGVSTTAALNALSIDGVSWLSQRIGIAVFIVLLSGFNRYVPVVKVSLAERLANIEEQKQIAAARRDAFKAQLSGMVQTARATLETATHAPEAISEPVPESMAELPAADDDSEPNHEALSFKKQSDAIKKRQIREAKVRKWLEAEPSLTIRQIQARFRKANEKIALQTVTELVREVKRTPAAARSA